MFWFFSLWNQVFRFFVLFVLCMKTEKIWKYSRISSVTQWSQEWGSRWKGDNNEFGYKLWPRWRAVYRLAEIENIETVLISTIFILNTIKFRILRDWSAWIRTHAHIPSSSPAEETAEGFTGQSSNSLNIFTGEGIFLDRKEHSSNRGNTLSGGELFLFLNVFFSQMLY